MSEFWWFFGGVLVGYAAGTLTIALCTVSGLADENSGDPGKGAQSDSV